VAQAFDKHVCGNDVGANQQIGIASDRACISLGFRRFLADRQIIRNRPFHNTAGDGAFLVHALEGGGVHAFGHFFVDRFGRGQHSHLGLRDTHAREGINGVLKNVFLLLEGGRNIDGRITQGQQLGIGAHLHDVHVGNEAAGAKARFFLEQALEQRAGGDDALENKVRAPFLDGNARLKRGSCWFRRIHNFPGGYVQIQSGQPGFHRRAPAKQHRFHKAHFHSVPHGFQHMGIRCFHHGHAAFFGLFENLRFQLFKCCVRHG